MTETKAAGFDAKTFLARVGTGKSVAKYRNRQPVYQQGDEADAVYFIQSGKVKVSVISDRAKEAVVALLDEGAAIPADKYQAALARTDAARKQVALLFGDCDAMLMPSATGAAPKGLSSTGDPVFNRLASTLHLPAVNIPVYRSKKRMPLGLQLVGARLQDEKLLAIAKRVIELLRSNTHD